MTMFYYIAESSKNDLFTNTLIRRFASYDDAASFCKDKVREWREQGLNADISYDVDVWYNPELAETANVVGAQALDSEYVAVHNYFIFATPCFMGGGSIEA